MTQIRDARVAKRPGSQNLLETGRRRAPYAWRACDACRRRKGKCDGQQPCRYCAGRDRECNYDGSFFGSEDWPPPIPSAPGEHAAVVPVGRTDDRPREKQATNPSPSASTSDQQDAIMDMLSSLQGQLNSLRSRVQAASQSPQEPLLDVFSADEQNEQGFLSTLMDDVIGHDDYFDDSIKPILSSSSSSSLSLSSSRPSFYGLPSPVQSMHSNPHQSDQQQQQQQQPRQPQLHQVSFSVSQSQQRERRYHDSTSDAEDIFLVSKDCPADRSPTTTSTTQTRRSSPFLRFQSLMSLQETLQMLHVYQEAIGHLHPILDMHEITQTARDVYADIAESTCLDETTAQAVAAREDDLLILCLALVIGLHVHTDLSPMSSSRESESLILEDVQAAVNSKLAAPASSINDVVVILLKGSYDFFNDMPRLAWRMCGIAGRMFMELGFQNGVILSHMLESQAQRSKVWNILSSIIILDREWSAAASLPANFQESTFGPVQTSSIIKTPYLEAMLSFIILSDKLSEPIAQAVKAQQYSDDDDVFEVMNFRIEQWRKKAVVGSEPSVLRTRQLSPLNQPPPPPPLPTWKILLSLRAECVRSLLFKPHFFSKANVQTSTQYVRPAIEVLFDVCNVLYNLNTTSDIYRKQQPFYHPLLASAAGLGFVLTAFLERNRAAASVHAVAACSLSAEIAGAMGRSYEMAVALATGYATTSKAARQLAEKLAEVRDSLVELGVLSRSPRHHADDGVRRRRSPSHGEIGFRDVLLGSLDRMCSLNARAAGEMINGRRSCDGGGGGGMSSAGPGAPNTPLRMNDDSTAGLLGSGVYCASGIVFDFLNLDGQ